MLTKILKWQFSAKKIYQAQACKNIVKRTTSTISEIVSITLGPKGRNVLFENEKYEPRITKDGVTVCKQIEFEDRFEDAISTLVKKSVNSTNKFAGDGTTTSTLLIGQIIKHSHRKLAAGVSVKEIKEGLKIGRDIGIEFLSSCSRSISTKQECLNVAMISTNGDPFLSQLVSDALSKTLNIIVEKSQKNESFVEYYTGVKIVRGIPHPDFKNNGDKIVYDYPLILMSKAPIHQIQQILPALELAQKAKKQLLIFAHEVSESVLSTLIYNKRNNIVEACAIALPEYGDKPHKFMIEASEATGSYLFSQYGDSIQNVEFRHLGKAIKAEIDQLETWVLGQNSKEFGNAIIYAGGGTEVTSLETYDKIIDALNSVKSAKQHGVIAGGGITYWRLADLLDAYEGQWREGVRVLAEALRAPRKKLVATVRVEDKPLSGNNWEAYNFKTQLIEDMFDVGIVDSVLVGKNVLIDAVSLSHLLIDIDIAIIRDSFNLDPTNYSALNAQHAI